MTSSGLRKQHNRQLNICWREQYICLHLDWENNTISIQMKSYVLFLPTYIQLSIMLFSQSRWRHMYCSLQQIFNCLLCCSLNPDEDICTVPSNRYSIVYCVVLSIQMKTYVLFLPTDIQLSIVLFPQSRWRHMYCSFQHIFNCLLCCSLIPDEDICTVPSNRYSIVYYVVLSFQMKIYVLFPGTDISLVLCIVFFFNQDKNICTISFNSFFNDLLCCLFYLMFFCLSHCGICLFF
jgi:hypothetical protein